MSYIVVGVFIHSNVPIPGEHRWHRRKGGVKDSDEFTPAALMHVGFIQDELVQKAQLRGCMSCLAHMNWPFHSRE